MKFTIGAISNIQQYEEDLKLIKSSLLYADDIELIGLAEYLTFIYLPRVFDSKKDVFELVDGIVPFLRSANSPLQKDALAQIEAIQSQMQPLLPFLTKKRHRTTAEIQAQLKLKQLSKTIAVPIEEIMQKYTDDPSSQELKALIDRNIINVFDYKMKGVNTGELTGGYIGSLLNSIYSPNTFPLFDEKSTSFIGDIAKTKVIQVSALKAETLRHAGIASSILMTLPTIETATIDELLDFKAQNEVPLARFRKAIYGFSERISSLPWDSDFQYECIKLYDTEVVPQVAEINEIFTETSTLKNFGRKALADGELRKQAGFAAGGLATAITTSSSLDGMLRSLLMAMSLAAFCKEAAMGFLNTINLWTQAHDEAKKARESKKDNVMYYYYLASKI